MEKEIRIDLLRCIKAVVLGWYKVLLLGLIVAFVAFLATYGKPLSYSARTSLYGSSYGNYQETQQTLKSMQSYSDIIYSQKVAERAANLIDGSGVSASMISSMISVKVDEDSAIMYVYATSAYPDVSVDVANAVAQAFVVEAKSITGNDNIKILDEAVYASSSTPNYIKYPVLGFAAGMVLMALIICLIEIFSDAVYYVEDASLDGELDIIGIIPLEKEI